MKDIENMEIPTIEEGRDEVVGDIINVSMLSARERRLIFDTCDS